MNKYEKAVSVLKEPIRHSMVERTESIELAIRVLERLSKLRLLWRLFK